MLHSFEQMGAPCSWTALLSIMAVLKDLSTRLRRAGLTRAAATGGAALDTDAMALLSRNLNLDRMPNVKRS